MKIRTGGSPSGQGGGSRAADTRSSRVHPALSEERLDLWRELSRCDKEIAQRERLIGRARSLHVCFWLKSNKDMNDRFVLRLSIEVFKYDFRRLAIRETLKEYRA